MKIQKDPKRASSSALPPLATRPPQSPVPPALASSASSPGPSASQRATPRSDGGAGAALSRGLSMVGQTLAAAASMVYSGTAAGAEAEGQPPPTVAADAGAGAGAGASSSRQPHSHPAPLDVKDKEDAGPPATVVVDPAN